MDVCNNCSKLDLKNKNTLNVGSYVIQIPARQIKLIIEKSKTKSYHLKMVICKKMPKDRSHYINTRFNYCHSALLTLPISKI